MADDKGFSILFRETLPNGDEVEYIVWTEGVGGAVRINGKIQETADDPMAAYLRLTHRVKD